MDLEIFGDKLQFPDFSSYSATQHEIDVCPKV